MFFRKKIGEIFTPVVAENGEKGYIVSGGFYAA